MQSFHISFQSWAQAPDDLYAAAILRSRLCHNWIKGAKAYMAVWTPGSSCNWIKILSPSYTAWQNCWPKGSQDLQKACRSPCSWGCKVTKIKKFVTFSFYFSRRKSLLKIFHHRFPSESSQPIYINETAPVKEPARKRRKLSAPKICSKDKSSISQGRGDLNAFCLKGRYKKQGKYYSRLMISVAVINK